MSALPAREGTVFPTYRENRLWILLGFIGVSLLAHAAAFLILQVVYPQRVTIPPPRVQVSLLTAATPEHEAILRWVAAEDPALVAAGSAAIPPALFEIPYRPSFATLRTPPRTMPPETPLPEPAPSPIALPLLPSEAPAHSPETTARVSVPTSLVLGGALAGRHFTARGELGEKADAPLQPATFLLGADAAGEIRHVFLQRSSGDAAVDQSAADYLVSGKLDTGAGENLAWGMGTFTWGDEIYASPAPTPP